MKKTAITPTREQDYPQWYQQVVQAAELAESSPVRGCMVIKPWGYALWEAIQQDLDQRFKATGHVNAYFPLLIPLSHLQKEADHIEGFAKECAVVTHSRLQADQEGQLQPEGALEEPYIIRPTSETIIGEMYAKWVQSYRDLPILINQWANVMRWEMRTRLFLRTSEFLWQEGHTAHATAKEAMHETRQMLDVYADCCRDLLAMPVIKGEKTVLERFPGAVNTYCIEAMMQDRKALQAGTSHFLGQNFSRAAGIAFSNQQGEQELAWTTSWGVSTRLIGGVIMTHSDDDGLVLPPRIAPQAVVIVPIYRNDDEKNAVLTFCDQLAQQLRQLDYHRQPLRVQIDKRELNGGEKNWSWIKKGVPIRLEIGPRDLANNSVMLARRDRSPKDKTQLPADSVCSTIIAILDDIQTTLYQRAQTFLQQHSTTLRSQEEFNDFFAQQNGIHGGFAHCFAADNAGIENYLKPLKVTTRCIPLENNEETGTCIFTGESHARKMILAKAY